MDVLEKAFLDYKSPRTEKQLEAFRRKQMEDFSGVLKEEFESFKKLF